MTDYPEAPRYIEATPALLGGWCGPVVQVDGDGVDFLDARLSDDPATGCLDPMRPEVRDHMIRALKLPGWMRDGDGLEPWQSAGLIACAAVGWKQPRMLMPWRDDCDGHKACRRWFQPEERVCGVYINHLAGWRATTPCVWTEYGPEAGWEAKPAADTAALAHGCALLDGDTLTLPWSGGPRVWRRDPAEALRAACLAAVGRTG